MAGKKLARSNYQRTMSTISGGQPRRRATFVPDKDEIVTAPTTPASPPHETHIEKGSLALWREIPHHPLVVLPVISFGMMTGVLGFLLGAAFKGVVVPIVIIPVIVFFVVMSFAAGRNTKG